jgi:hypothetical protein
MGQMKHWLLFSVRVYTHTHHKRARQAGGPFAALYRSHFCGHIHVNVFILGRDECAVARLRMRGCGRTPLIYRPYHSAHKHQQDGANEKRYLIIY